MLPIIDPQLRAALLNYLTVRLIDATPDEVEAAGLSADQLTLLGELSTADLNDLAAKPEPCIGMSIDGRRLASSLRAVALHREAKTIERYFLVHGASWQLVRALFHLSRNAQRERRRSLGVERVGGYLALPGPSQCERIRRRWVLLEGRPLRERYYALHRQFPSYPIATLERVVSQLEENA